MATWDSMTGYVEGIRRFVEKFIAELTTTSQGYDKQSEVVGSLETLLTEVESVESRAVSTKEILSTHYQAVDVIQQLVTAGTARLHGNHRLAQVGSHRNNY